MIETKFKDTEVGKIPEDWEVKQLKDFATLINGRAYKQEELLPNGKYKVLRVGNFFSNDNWYYSNLELNNNQYCNNGDLLYAWSCTYGAYIWDQPKTVFHYHIWKVIPNRETHKLFLQYLLNNDVEEQKKTSQGSTMSHITKGFMEDRLFPIPPLSEQTRIATALSNVDALISGLDKLIEKKRAIKQGAMQQLLTGKIRLRGFSEPWVEVKLGEVCEVKRGVRVTRELLASEGEYPVYQNTNYPLGFFDKYNVSANTPFVIIGGSAGVVGLSKTNYWAADDCAYFTNCKRIDKNFLYYDLLLRQGEIKRHVRTASVPRLDRKNIEELELQIPSLSEQSAIATALSSMDDEIVSLEAKREKYIAIKQGMMQQLLTGKIRLVETAVKTKATIANVHFRRSVLAAEIADRLCEEPTFGHVKMEKILFLTERLCHIDIGSHYHRDAAGPYDNNALRSIDSQLKKQKWFEVQHTEKGNRYVPMQDRGKHKTYFDRYYSDVVPTFEKIINTFKTQRTEQCEIVATLYSAWEDLLHSNKPFTDADIVNEVLNNWHESKKRISQDRWLSAIRWMRENGFAPDMSVYKN